jgi:hypothetical protein
MGRKRKIEWSDTPPVDIKTLLNTCVIKESEYDPEKHGEITVTVNSIEEFFELFPEHIELNMAILKGV